MTRNEKIETILKVLTHNEGAWQGIDDKQLDVLFGIVNVYLKGDKIKELNKIIADTQATIEAITKEAV